MAGNDSPCPCRPPAEQRRECSALVSQHRSFPRRWCWLLISRSKARFCCNGLIMPDFRMISIHSRARAAAARYIVRTLRELLDTSLRGDADRPLRRSNGSRVPTGDAQELKRWDRVWKKSRGGPGRPGRAHVARTCGENLPPAVLRGHVDPLTSSSREANSPALRRIFIRIHQSRASPICWRKGRSWIVQRLPNGKIR